MVSFDFESAGGGGGGGDTNLTSDEVTAFSWHPGNTDWKLYFNDFAAYRSFNATNNAAYPGGTIGLSTVISGTGRDQKASATAYADRYGVITNTVGTSAAALAGFQQTLNNTFRFGDSRVKVGSAIKLIDLPDATEDWSFTFSLGDNSSVSSTNCAAWYIQNGVNATNWVTWNNGASTDYVDSGTAFSTSWAAIEIDIAADLSSVKYYLNGTLEYTETRAAYIPVAGTKCNLSIVGRNSSGATATHANTWELDWAYLAFKPTNSRDTLTTWLT